MKFISQHKNLKGKTVLLRADFDDPHQGGRLLDDYRIRMSTETIKFLHQRGAKVIVVSKTGRPDGFDVSESLMPEARRLADLLNKKLVVVKDRLPEYDLNHIIFFPGDIREQKNIDLIKKVHPKDLVVLENIRFYQEEQNLDRKFAKSLASIADLYVDDAFAMAHRNEVTTAVLPELLPGFAGLRLEKEIKALDKLLTSRTHPFLVLMGGAKISDKVGAIKSLGRHADKILIGGGPANLFLLAKGYEIGKSICEKDQLKLAKELWRNFKDKLILPVDVLVAKPDFSDPHFVGVDQVKKDQAIFDIGPKTILEFAMQIKTAKKMVWNGPMGHYEIKNFSHGTFAIAELFASKCQRNCYGVAGGGDSVSALTRAKVLDQIDFVSTGGGAMLDYLAGEKLPALEALEHSK